MTSLALSLLAALAALPGEGVILQDGRELEGRIVGLKDGLLTLEGQTDPLALDEVNAIVLAGESPSSGGPPPMPPAPGANGPAAKAPAAKAPAREVDALVDLDSGPIVRFREGEMVRGRVVEASGSVAKVLVEPKGPMEPKTSTDAKPPRQGKSTDEEVQPLVLSVPLEIIVGFRLREASAADAVFEADLQEGPPVLLRRPAGAPPEAAAAPGAGSDPALGAAPASPPPAPQDTVYVRRSGGLLRAEGAFQSLDAGYLTLSIDGKPRRLKRELVHGVILAPVASGAVESEIPAVLELGRVGQIPVFVREIRPAPSRPDETRADDTRNDEIRAGVGAGAAPPRREIVFRFRGSRADEIETVPAAAVRRIKLSSDRVLFLSAAEPSRVEEVPFLGSESTFGWRKDLAVSGGPLKLAGRTYRRGIGVHSRAALEFDVGGRYRSLAAVIGLDDSAGKESCVTFRVLADSKEIFAKDMKSGQAPENLSLPVVGVKVLRLEVDYGEDGVDFGDYADWAELRVFR